LVLGYAIKKVVKLIAVIVGVFVAGLAYLQYQQIASIDWDRIEILVNGALGNVTSHISNNQEFLHYKNTRDRRPLTRAIPPLLMKTRYQSSQQTLVVYYTKDINKYD
jgi:hypothetical protein